MRVQTLLKQASANASEHATEDQASDHSEQSHPHRAEFELEVTEEAPTEDQLKSILEYIGIQNAGSVIRGAKDEADAMRKLKQSGDNVERPIVCLGFTSSLEEKIANLAQTVDWSNGKAVIGANESEILKLVNALSKE